MSLYSNYILPPLIEWAMNEKRWAPLRKKLLSFANGTVAEIGFGAGANLPFYPDSVEKIVAIEPSKQLIKRAQKRISTFRGSLEMCASSAEKTPLKKGSVDCVVSTFTLCSVSNTLSVLQEIRRVLRPRGTFLFLEHGLAPDRSVQKWQKRLTPLQRRIGGGCHLDRNILGLLADACWDVSDCERFYTEGMPKIAGFLYLGQAQS